MTTASTSRATAVAVAFGLALASSTPANAQRLTNGQWTIGRIDGETVRLTGPDGATAEFGMTFRVFLATSDPGPAKTQVSGVNYNGGTSWIASVPDPDSGISGGTTEDWGDGFDPDVVTHPGSRTANLFNAAASKEIRPVGDSVEEDGILYQFAPDPTFAFSARLGFDGETGVPVVTTTLESTGTAWFSVAYLGAPACAFEEAEQVWQPLVWQGRRFPSTSYLTAAYHCPVPSTLVTQADRTVGVVAHPGEFPFMPLPLFENSRFGVAVRNAAGQAQPILAAPILGGPGSRLTAGQSFTFRMCPFVTAGDTTIAFERIARDLYDFRDVRHNQIGSLNEALENMVAYGKSSHSHFLEQEKGCSYATDAPGTVKNVSSLSPLEMALTTDDEEIWQRRAYPYIEYMLSRKKFLFTTDESQNIQSPSYTLEGPVAPISELVALNSISNGAAAEMLELAESEYQSSRVRNLSVAEPGATWQNALHLYRATGETSYLQAAIEGADAYIARRITDLPETFNDPDASLFFWTGFAPRFIDLLLLHEATGEPRFLDASWKAARFFAMHCWFAPRIPDAEVTVNQGGVAPTYWYLRNRTKGPIPVAEESVPAWRVSAQGLTCESSGTSTGHRAIFMANYAPWFLRLGWLKDDEFLRDIARSAMVGRWMNFPGYHMNTGRTTVYEKADYPLRPFDELSYNSFHFNHIWPLMSVSLDYLVTDAETRSDGAIFFEREFIEGYAYLQSSYFGMRPGRFHDEEPVRLWMPRGLADISTDELNYIAARGEDTLCLAFTNQNFAEETATVSLDAALVPELAGRTRTARVWIDNQPAPPIQVSDGSFSLTVPAKGIAAVVIDHASVQPAFQEGFADLSEADAWMDGHLEWSDPAARAMVLNFGSGYRSFYFYLKDSKRDFNSLRLRHEIDGRYGEAADDAFPWEFTVPLGPDDRSVLFALEATRPDGSVETFGPSVLVQDASGGFRLGDSTVTRRVVPGSRAARIPGRRLLADPDAASARRVAIVAPGGRFLDNVEGTPALGTTARSWVLIEVAPGEFTLQDGITGACLALRSPSGTPADAELVLDATSTDRFALEPVAAGGQVLRHMASGLHVLPAAEGILFSAAVGTDPGWTLTPALSSRLILGENGPLLAASGLAGTVDVAPAGSTGHAVRWEVIKGPDGTIHLLHAASNELLTLVEESSEWIDLPVVEDIRIRSSNEPQGLDWDLAAGSIDATTNFRSLLRFDLSGLPPGFVPVETELTLDVRTRDSTSASASHTLQLLGVTQPYTFTGVTWTTAGTDPWSQPGGTYDPEVLASATANPATVNGGQDLVFGGTAAFAAAVQEALGGDATLDLLLRSDRESTGRSFFWLASREDDGVGGLEGPRLRVRAGAGTCRWALRPAGETGGQAFRWVEGKLLQEAASGRFLTLTDGALATTLEQAAASPIQVTEPESGSSLDGSLLDQSYLWSWFGIVDPSSLPWCFHTELGWVYLGWEGTDSLWGWIDGLGWFYTSALTYPLCFSQQNDGWMLVENLPDEGTLRFAGLDSNAELRLPAGSGFDVAAWMETGAVPAPPSSPPPSPGDASPTTEPVLAPSTRLLGGPGPDSWRLVTHGTPGQDLILSDSRDLLSWSWLDELQPIDQGPIIFQLTRATSAGFWRVSSVIAP